MHKIDLKNWDRAQHFEFFNKLRQPNYAVCANVNVNGLYKLRQEMKSKNINLKISELIYYCAARSANSIAEMRMRIVDNAPVIYDRIDIGFTYIPKGRELHANCVAEYHPQFTRTQQSIEAARKESDLNPTLTPKGAEGQNLFYFSILPDIELTCATNPWGNPKEDSVPRMLFGKIHEIDNVKMIPVSVEALHSFIDGKHLAIFFNEMNKLGANPKQYLDL